MGQAQSAQNDDQNCFRGCIKQNKTKTKKIQAQPHYGQKKASDIYKETPQAVNHPPPKDEHSKSPIKLNANAESLETSLQQRLYIQQATIKKKNSLQCSTNIITNDPKDPPIVEGAADTSCEIVLGLQSKLSSTKNTFYVSPSKLNFARTNAFYETTTPATQSNSHEKESGSQTRISNKTSKTATSTRSRNILINKIQEIKQKYYERQLEIEICHDQREYQAQIDQIEQIEITFTENSNLPQQSIGQIKAIRNKILAKLREKREKDHQKSEKQKNQKDESLLEVKTDKSIAVHNQLELYSKQGRATFQQTLYDSQTTKKQRKTKNHLSYSGRILNKSLNNSLHEGSVDQKMEFSDYSQESLHQIRQLDEEYEDYRSKMTGPSAFHKNNIKSIKPSNNNIPSHLQRQPTISRFTKNNSAYAGQPEHEHESQLNTHQVHVLDVPHQNKEQYQNSQVKSYRTKNAEGTHPTLKSKKILLF